MRKHHRFAADIRPHLFGFIAVPFVLVMTGTATASPYSDAVLADSPIAYFRFEDAGDNTGATAVNSSTSGVADGTYNDPTGSNLALTPNSLNGGTNGLGNAILVSQPGTPDARIVVPNGATLDMAGTGNVTFETWLNTTTTQNFARVFDNGWDSANDSYFFGLDSGGDQISIGVDGTLISLGGPIVNDGAWHHVVVTYDSADAGQRWKLYVDGSTLDASSSTAVTFGTSVPANMHIFTHFAGAGDPFNGLMDEIAIYSTTLSPARIQAHFDAAIEVGGAASATPEPSTFALAVLGLATLGGLAWRRRRKSGIGYK